MLKYQILASKLRSKILERIRDGNTARLPTVTEIAKAEKYSLNTVQRAIEQLKNEGLIVAQRGRGTFPATGNVLAGQQFPPRFTETKTLPIRMIAFEFLNNLKKYAFEQIMFDGLQKLVGQEGRGRALQYHCCSLFGELIQPPPEIFTQKVLGSICVGCFDDEYLLNLAKKLHPFVSLDRDATTFGVDSIVLNNESAAYQVTRRLLDLGHRKIAYLGSEETVMSGYSTDPAIEERYRGFRAAMMHAGIAPSPQLCPKIAGRSEKDADEALKSLLAKRRSFTALVTYDDNFASVALKALREKGVLVPKQCSVAAAGAIDPEGSTGGAYFQIEDMAERSWSLLEKAARPRRRSKSEKKDEAWRVGELVGLSAIVEARKTMRKPGRKGGGDS